MAKIMESDRDKLIEMVRLFDKIIKHLRGDIHDPLSKRAACLISKALDFKFLGHHPMITD